MPIVSTFFGIIVRMYYQEHGVPHFHVEYQGEQASFAFDGRLIAGTLRSRTALRLVKDWATDHRAELDDNWTRMQAGEPLERIPPLD